MKNEQKPEMKVDRRTTIKWLAATMAATGAGCGSTGKYVGEEIPAAPATDGPLLGTAQEPDGLGIGVDPDLINPVVPWQRTMTQAQLDTAAALADIILPADDRSPAASEVGVHEFIDEWVSAPYPQQRQDRDIIFAALEWLERKSRERFDVSFVDATVSQQVELIDSVALLRLPDYELPPQPKPFVRFRYLAVGAYYTTQVGIDDIGYQGNIPIANRYPGPSGQAMAHVVNVLKDLRLADT